MKIYVDELPNDCIDCPCECEYYCNLLNEDVGCCKYGEIHKGCPLQSLADYTKQVRREVCKEIKEEFKKHLFDWYKDEQNINKELYIDANWVWEILDQIQGE